MNLLHNLIKSTGWLSIADRAPLDDNDDRNTQEEMDSHAGELRNELVQNGYNAAVDKLRAKEYPQLEDVTYLDHAGTTIYASSLIRQISDDLLSNLYGNPHSQSPSSQLTSKRIRDTRLKVLRLFNASPEEYDIVFCASATAGMKLVMEAFSAQGTFPYRYHKDCHTSAVGIRETSGSAKCFVSDGEVEAWLCCGPTEREPNSFHQGLFVYPAQSNFSGRRLPLSWPTKLRTSGHNFWSLVDAAALVTTAALDISSIEPDFAVVSFYKMFGYPDLGGLLVRKATPGMTEFLERRRYFGGGTVAAVIAQNEHFHAKRNGVPHENMEDGTLPFHSILALDNAIDVQRQLFGDYSQISKHTTALAMCLYQHLLRLEHYNKRHVCKVYSEPLHFQDGCPWSDDWSARQGPIVTFNMKRSDGGWVGYSEVEKLAAIKGIHIRTGGLCNPGGIESYIGLKPWEIKQNYESGHRCWDDQDVLHGKPTGAIRVSIGPMTTYKDITRFVAFLKEFYVEKARSSLDKEPVRGNWGGKASAVVESITIYPIKSCGGYKIPAGVTWELKPHGLEWDREWCLVHLGTGSAMNQKQYNKMALIRPSIDLTARALNVTAVGSFNSISVPLAFPEANTLQTSASRVCGDKIDAMTYSEPEIIEFFSTAIGVPCTLARFPSLTSKRHFKPHLAAATNCDTAICEAKQPPILLSNESPILLVNRSSVDYLNEIIKLSGGKGAKIDAFRANIVISEIGPNKSPYAEDTWKHLQIGREYLELLGPCRRCQMVCIDQQTAVKHEEPYVTLSKTRKIGGRILFGQHATHLSVKSRLTSPGIKVGDLVRILDSEPEMRNDEKPA
ncbi:pyridoxal phosphate-dependent transferase [Kalaharituber pfeilii]|nr:pyridoxal phosphate-dependent transferase [Kalaharituber pfeilii]